MDHKIDCTDATEAVFAGRDCHQAAAGIRDEVGGSVTRPQRGNFVEHSVHLCERLNRVFYSDTSLLIHDQRTSSFVCGLTQCSCH